MSIKQNNFHVSVSKKQNSFHVIVSKTRKASRNEDVSGHGTKEET